MKVVKRVDFKSSHDKKKLCMVTDANQTNCGEHFAIFKILNHYVIHLKLVFYQLYLKKLVMQN